jgi:intracellular sulfur oxidation DsrE/DsrF family protein
MNLESLMKSAAVALILTLATGSATMAVAAEKRHGVVMQVSDNNPATWNLTLNNAKNLTQALKGNVDIEIVAYGPGLNMLKFDSAVANRLSEAEKSGVTLAACGNTMKAMKVTEKDLHDGVKVVPGGVVEIMQKQEAGWAYVKP